jgi:Immunoglobulin I-set domain
MKITPLLLLAGGLYLAATTHAADPLNTWTLRSPLPTPNPLRDIVYTNGLWVAVGDSGTVLTSSDEGQTWTRQFTSITNHSNAFLGIAHGAGRYVAVTSFGASATSTDGTNWSFHPLGRTNFAWESITYADGRFVAGGVSATNIAVSTDGMMWSYHVSGVSGQVYDVAHAAGLFVATVTRPGFNDGSILTSPDGTNWTPRVTNLFTGFGLRGVTHGNGRFVVVGNSASLVSTDGVAWTTNFNALHQNRLAVTFGNGQFVAVGAAGSFANIGVSFSSTDGTNWTTGTGTPAEAVTFGNGRFASAGAPASLNAGVPNVVSFCTNVSTWTSPGFGGAFNSSITQRNRRGLTFGGGQFAAIENDSSVTLTTDGLTYSNGVTVFGGRFRAVAYGSGRFVAARSNAPGFSIFHASDFGWVQGGGADGIVNAMVATNSLWVAVGQGGYVATSPDGISWTASVPATTNHLLAVAHGAGAFVGVGLSGAAVRSSDGTNWTATTVGGAGELRSVAYGVGTFVAVGFGGKIFTSPNGTVWTQRVSGTLLALNSVSHCLGRLVAVGDGGATLSSTDGVTWTRATTVTEENLQAVAASPALAVAVGDVNGRQTSSDTLVWKSPSALTGPNLWRVIFHQGRFLAATDAGAAYSTSGRSWQSFNLIGTLYGILATNSLLVGVGSGDFATQPNVQVSADQGATWYRTNLAGGGGYLDGIAHGNGTYVAVGQNGLVFTSPDALTWSNRTSGTSSTLYDVAFGNGIFVATIAGSSNVLTSPNGITWTTRGTVVGGNYDTVVFRDGLFYGAGTRIATSPDGIAWTDRGAPSAQLIGMEKAGNAYVAYGSTGTLLTSTNLTTWSNIATLTVQQLKGAAFGNDTFVVVGRGGVVFQSDPLTSTPVTILSPPTNTTVLAGASVTFSVGVIGRAPFSYQWFRNGAPINGATGPTLTLTGVTTAAAGGYHVVINNDTTSATSATATLTVLEVSVAVQPEVLYAFLGGSATFTAAVTGATPIGYQWDNNGNAIAGATNATFVFLNAQPSNTLGQYYVTAKFPYGSKRSSGAYFVVLTSLGEVNLAVDPGYQALPIGDTASITSLVYGPLPNSFQWFKDNTPLPGATNAVLTLPNLVETNSGDYTFAVTYGLGSLTNTSPSTLLVYYAEPPVITGFSNIGSSFLQIEYTGLVGRAYEVNYTTNLAGPIDWQYFDTTFLSANPGTYSFNPVFYDLTNRAYYRLKILPP